MCIYLYNDPSLFVFSGKFTHIPSLILYLKLDFNYIFTESSMPNTIMQLYKKNVDKMSNSNMKSFILGY